MNFWRTLLQDVENYIEDFETLKNWTQWFIPEISCHIVRLLHDKMVDRITGEWEIGEKLDVSIAMLKRRTRHKALFRTEGNYFGIATQALKEDDVIAVFAGCEDPYILRQCFADASESPSGQPREKEYTLIGPAYLCSRYHGWIGASKSSGIIRDYSHPLKWQEWHFSPVLGSGHFKELEVSLHEQQNRN